MEFTHYPFKIYTHGNSVNIEDIEEELTFLRTESERGYDVVIICENPPISSCLVPLDQPFGFVVYENIDSKKWFQLARNYMHHKRQGDMKSFLEKELWELLEAELDDYHSQSLSLPIPDLL